MSRFSNFLTISLRRATITIIVFLVYKIAAANTVITMPAENLPAFKPKKDSVGVVGRGNQLMAALGYEGQCVFFKVNGMRVLYYIISLPKLPVEQIRTDISAQLLFYNDRWVVGDSDFYYNNYQVRYNCPDTNFTAADKELEQLKKRVRQLINRSKNISMDTHPFQYIKNIAHTGDWDIAIDKSYSLYDFHVKMCVNMVEYRVYDSSAFYHRRVMAIESMIKSILRDAGAEGVLNFLFTFYNIQYDYPYYTLWNRFVDYSKPLYDNRNLGLDKISVAGGASGLWVLVNSGPPSNL